MANNQWRQVDGKWLYGDKKLTATKAIHVSCVECMGDNPRSVRACTNTECVRWLFRNGTNPSRKKPDRTNRNLQTGQFKKGKQEIFLDGKYKLVRIDE